MTDAKMALLELVEQEADTDLVREMLAFAAERMMDMEIEAKPSEKKPDPLAEPIHDPDPQPDPGKSVEEEGEPFDGNFA